MIEKIIEFYLIKFIIQVVNSITLIEFIIMFVVVVLYSIAIAFFYYYLQKKEAKE